MVFRKKKPKRLYYPTKSRWYKQPRRRPKVRRSRQILKHNVRTRFTKLFKNAIYFIIGAVIIAVFVIVFVFSSYLSITSIEIVREDFNIDSAAITNELNQYIGRNILLFPRSKIVNTVQEKFPEFMNVKVNKVFPHAIKISLESYPIVANVRAYYVLPEAEIPEEDATIAEVYEALETAFSLDEESVEEEAEPIEQKCLLNRIGQAIFDQEENLELMNVIIDDLKQPIEDREIIIPKEHMDYMLDAIRYFNNSFKMQVRGLRYLSVAREVHIKTDSGIMIWLTFVKDYKKQMDKLGSIYEAAEFDKEDLAYIDLRVQEKVIYCPLRSNCNP